MTGPVRVWLRYCRFPMCGGPLAGQCPGVEPRDVVVVGGSAGSLVPLRQFVAALPAELSGAVVITIHIAEQARSRLPAILERAGPLPAAHAETGEQVRPGRIYVAPPGCHLLMPGGTVELSNGPRINHTRPAIDATFASAARWFGDRVVAVMLSGLLDDGAVGSALIEQAGGLVVAQDPQEAAQPSMPEAALAAAPSAIAAPGARLGELVAGMLGDTGLVSWPRQQPRRRAWSSPATCSSGFRRRGGRPAQRHREAGNNPRRDHAHGYAHDFHGRPRLGGWRVPGLSLGSGRRR